MHDAITLRPVVNTDLAKLAYFSCDPVSNFMAGFGRENFTDYVENLLHWQKIVTAPECILRVIEYLSEIVGSVILYPDDVHQEITYWIAREYWGKGIATRGVKLFLDSISSRPIYARVAGDNHGSMRVLELNGFRCIGTEFSYAPSRKVELAEFIYVLDEG